MSPTPPITTHAFAVGTPTSGLRFGQPILANGGASAATAREHRRSRDRRSLASAWLACAALVLLTLTGCSDDAAMETRTTSSDGGNGAGGEGVGGSGAGGSATGGSGGGSEELVWPNPMGPENGSPWLRAHHAELTRIEPRLLVLDVVNRPDVEITTLEQLVEDNIAAFADGSRYHAYSDPSSPVFLQYQVDKIVDLKDPGGAAYPDFWPPETANGFDVGQLFTEEFAPRLGYEDPEKPGDYLTMCELFERGIINELWISSESGTRNIYENQSHLQKYDDDLNPIDGKFNDCTNGCFYDPNQLVNCKVSTRMLEINKQRGPGCGTHAAGHAQENLRYSIPYFADNAERFYRFDLDTRYGLSKPDLYACGYDPGNCIDLLSADHAVSAAQWPGQAFDVTGWGSGCGNVHFAANSRAQYDYDSSVPSLSECEGYGLGEEADGSDTKTTFTNAKTDAYDALHPDCGGGWMVYMGQSMPGLGNKAKGVDGAPMLNWWTFLFY